MARRVHVTLVDDFDGTEAAETVVFSLDGVHYEIDLSETNAARLREELGPWVESARRVGGRRQTGRRGSSGTSTERGQELARVRQWGRENGYQVGERGRISPKLEEAYAAAH